MALIPILLALAVLGMADSGYLVWKHQIKKQALVCPLNSDCNAVTDSKWGRILGVRNDILGFFYYIAIFVLGIFIFSGYEYSLYLLTAAFLAFAFSAFLLYIQKYVIKSYCFYCIMSAVINLLIFISAIGISYGQIL